MPNKSTVLYRVPEVAEVEVKPGVVKKMDMDTLLMVKPTVIWQREVPATAPATAP
jgi:hypothetical protein